jgi:hypothetical protein
MNGDDGDLDIDLRLRLGVLNTIEDRNRADYANGIRRTRGEPPPIKVLELLCAFAEERIQGAMRQGNTRQGVRALLELEIVLRDLVRYGHKEFEAMLRGFDAGWRRCLVAARTRLVRDYLSLETPAEELPAIQALIVEIIERGAWPTWREDYDAAIDAEVERRRRSPSIIPAA